MRLFTKSAFKQALFCPASLYYYYDREHYANQMNEDDFLQALAEGGNQVGDLAKSWDSSKDSFVTKRNTNKVDAGILEYVYDVAFQKYVIQKALGPGITVKAFLMMPDKSIMADADRLQDVVDMLKEAQNKPSA